MGNQRDWWTANMRVADLDLTSNGKRMIVIGMENKEQQDAVTPKTAQEYLVNVYNLETKKIERYDYFILFFVFRLIRFDKGR